eukprot:403336370
MLSKVTKMSAVQILNPDFETLPEEQHTYRPSHNNDIVTYLEEPVKKIAEWNSQNCDNFVNRISLSMYLYELHKTQWYLYSPEHQANEMQRVKRQLSIPQRREQEEQVLQDLELDFKNLDPQSKAQLFYITSSPLHQFEYLETLSHSYTLERSNLESQQKRKRSSGQFTK